MIEPRDDDDDDDVPAEKRKLYRVMSEAWRCALNIVPQRSRRCPTSGFDDLERRLAWEMLQCSNRRHFYATGEHKSWHSKASYAALFGCAPKTIQRKWDRFEQLGLLIRAGGGRGRDDPAKFVFVCEWLDRAIMAINRRISVKTAKSFARQVPFIEEKDEKGDTYSCPPFDDDAERGTSAEGGHLASKGGQISIERGTAKMSPDPWDSNPWDDNPVPSDDGAASPRVRATLPQSFFLRFVQLWFVYPRKGDEAEAKAAFKETLALVDYATIFEGARQFARHQDQFIRADGFDARPHLATWLRNEGWTNEYRASTTTKSKRRTGA
jgi:hypothetical protein